MNLGNGSFCSTYRQEGFIPCWWHIWILTLDPKSSLQNTHWEQSTIPSRPRVTRVCLVCFFFSFQLFPKPVFAHQVLPSVCLFLVVICFFLLPFVLFFLLTGSGWIVHLDHLLHYAHLMLIATTHLEPYLNTVFYSLPVKQQLCGSPGYKSWWHLYSALTLPSLNKPQQSAFWNWRKIQQDSVFKASHEQLVPFVAN